MTFKEMVEERMEQHETIMVYCRIPDVGLMEYDFPVEMVYEEEGNRLRIEGGSCAVTVSLNEEPEYDESDDTYGFSSEDGCIWIG